MSKQIVFVSVYTQQQGKSTRDTVGPTVPVSRGLLSS